MISLILDRADGYALVLIIIVLILLLLPVFLFLIGLFQLKKHKKRGQIILIIATVYTFLSIIIWGNLIFNN